MSATVIVGALIEQDGRYLLVQELKEKCYMQWNFPLGHLDDGELIQDGARREVKEESGYDVELTGLVNIVNNYKEDGTMIRFTYAGKIVGGDSAERLSEEINDVRWFTRAELEQMLRDGKLRGGEVIMSSVEQYETGELLSVDTVTDMKWTFDVKKEDV